MQCVEFDVTAPVATIGRERHLVVPLGLEAVPVLVGCAADPVGHLRGVALSDVGEVTAFERGIAAGATEGLAHDVHSWNCGTTYPWMRPFRLSHQRMHLWPTST